MKLLGISGSLRAGSSNTMLLHALAAHAPEGLTVDVFSHVGTLPIFNPDDEGQRCPQAVTQMLDQVRACDGVLIACPEYAHGIPGGLKNALDWMVSSDVAVSKPVALVHASLRSSHVRNHLSEVLRTMSFALDDTPPLEIALLGRSPGEIETLLADPRNVTAIRTSLASFQWFIAQARAS